MTLTAALMSCTVLGLQHGIDWDHVAAISDVTSVQSTTRDATLCGFNYAAGHAATVGLLGVAVIALRHSVPGTVSDWLQRFVGVTLVLPQRPAGTENWSEEELASLVTRDAMIGVSTIEMQNRRVQ